MFSYWVCAAVTLASALVSLGFAIVGVVRSGPGNVLESRYALSRSVALAVASAISLASRSVGFVAAVAIAMTLTQVADAVIGTMSRDRMKTVGPAVLAALDLAALLWLLVPNL